MKLEGVLSRKGQHGAWLSCGCPLGAAAGGLPAVLCHSRGGRVVGAPRKDFARGVVPAARAAVLGAGLGNGAEQVLHHLPPAPLGVGRGGTGPCGSPTGSRQRPQPRHCGCTLVFRINRPCGACLHATLARGLGSQRCLPQSRKNGRTGGGGAGRLRSSDAGGRHRAAEARDPGRLRALVSHGGLVAAQSIQIALPWEFAAAGRRQRVHRRALKVGWGARGKAAAHHCPAIHSMSPAAGTEPRTQCLQRCCTMPTPRKLDCSCSCDKCVGAELAWWAANDQARACLQLLHSWEGTPSNQAAPRLQRPRYRQEGCLAAFRRSEPRPTHRGTCCRVAWRAASESSKGGREGVHLVARQCQLTSARQLRFCAAIHRPRSNPPGIVALVAPGPVMRKRQQVGVSTRAHAAAECGCHSGCSHQTSQRHTRFRTWVC